MNPALLGLLVVAAIGIFLWAFLFVGGALIDASLARRKAAASGRRSIRSPLLNDLQPVEDRLVDFVRYLPELAGVLAVLASINRPASFARVVHEIRIGRVGPTDLKVAANLVSVALCILFRAGLLRPTRDGFVATELGREVQRRIDNALQSGSIHALAGQETRANWQTSAAVHTDQLSHLNHRTTISKETNNMNINNRNIIMTSADHTELSFAIAAVDKLTESGRGEMKALQSELARAAIVAPEDLPPDVITMNSCAELFDLDTKERIEFTLVFPVDANVEEGKMSVLAPLGTAMLGYRVGDEFEWIVPYGLRRLKVTAVRFQPEAALAMAA
ncbi:MAG: GreA/GreB family elongation factor [Terriglobales bacterium]